MKNFCTTNIGTFNTRTLIDKYPTVSMGDTITQKKEAFKRAYNVALEENLTNKIRRVENEHARCKNKKSKYYWFCCKLNHLPDLKI